MSNEVKPKRARIVPTPKQRRAARLMADVAMGKHKGKLESQGDIARAAGYSEKVALSPNKVLDNEGVKVALDELGFNADNAKKVVQQILNSSEAENRDRLKAADMVFKVSGEYASDKNAAKQTSNPIIFAKIEQHIFSFESEIKKALGYETISTIEEKSEEN